MSNRADQRKFHYIYKITRADGKYYIGMHSTDDLEDGYFGSGQLLWKSIKKHGKEKHSKEILEFLPTRKTLKERERELVNEEILDDPLCMNLKLGGEGGFNIDPAHQSELSKGYWKDEKYRQKVTSKLSEVMPDAVRKSYENPDRRAERGQSAAEVWTRPEYREKLQNFGKYERTPETLAKLSEAMSKAKSGKPWSPARRAAFERKKKETP